jgi:hypothetical protein
MLKRFERCRSHEGTTVSSRKRGHRWTDGYLRSVIVIATIDTTVRFIVNAVLSRNP